MDNMEFKEITVNSNKVLEELFLKERAYAVHPALNFK